MTTPTQAQIEAAARTLFAAEHGGLDDPRFGFDKSRIWEQSKTKFYERAKAALTAAAEVCPYCGERAIMGAFECRCTGLTAAAEVGEPVDKYYAMSIDRRNAIIERCAQVAENTPCLGYGKEPGEVVAAAIRALKNES